MRAPEKKWTTINGRGMGLEHIIMDTLEKPLPKSPTHYVLAEVLNTDLSVKRVTIYFNPEDTWMCKSHFDEGDPKGIGMAIGDGLMFLDRDPNTLYYTYYIVEIATNDVILKGISYMCNKCEL